MSVSRRLSYMMAILMFLSVALFCIPSVQVTAAGTSSDGSECFRFLTAVGVITASETYSADAPVSRGRFVQLSIGLSGVVPDGTASSDSGFADVSADHTYARAITYARKLGYISGSSSSLFNPDAAITCDQASKILCDILGYTHIATAYGGYPAGYARAGASIDLYDGVSAASSDELTMSDAIIMIANAADAEVMTIVSMGDTIEYETRENYTVLTERMGIEFTEGILTASECSDLYAPDSGLKPGTVAFDTLRLNAAGSDISNYVGYLMRAYYKDAGSALPELVYYRLSGDNTEISCDIEALEIDDGYLTYEIDSDTIKKINVKSDASYIINGKMASFRYSQLPNIDKGSVVFVSNDGDNVMDVVHVTSYETYTVSGVGVASNRIATEDGSFIELDPDNKEYRFEIYKNGNPSSLTSIAPGNIVLLAQSSGEGINQKTLLISDKIISGELEEKGENTVVVAGSRYDIAEDVAERIIVGKRYSFLTDYFGEIVEVRNSQSSVYGYLYGISANSFGEVKCRIYSENKHWVDLEFKNRLKFNGETVTEAEAYSRLGSDPAVYRDVIRYNVSSDNEVSSIEVARDMTGYSLISDEARVAADNNVFRKSYSDSQVWRSRSNSFEGKICVDSDSVIFFIPDDADMDDIMVMKPGALPSDDGYELVAYDVDKELNAPVIKIKKLPVGGGTSSNFFFVKSKGQAVDAEGDIVPSVRGYWRGFEVSVQVKLSANLTQAHIDAINIGDPILFSLDSDGKIVNFVNCAPDSNGYYSGPSGRGAYYTSSCQAGGIVLRNDYITGHLVVNSSLAGDYYNTQYSGETMVYIYNKTTEEYSVGTVADIVPGDVIVSKLMYFFSNEIAVIRE